jgi:hypothetical protein
VIALVRDQPEATTADTRPTQRERVAAATVIDADGRSRYRGAGVRGRMPTAQVDAHDVRQAARELEHARTKLVTAQAMIPGSRDRKRVELDAAHHVKLAGRFCDELLDRRRL